MTNKDRIVHLLSDIKELESAIAGMQEAEIYPVSFFSRSFDMQKAVLNHFELQLSDRTDNLTVVELIDKQLSNTFVHQLLNTFVKLFRLHRICIFDIFEHLGRETWQTFEMKILAFGQRISDLEITSVRQTDNIAGISFIDNFFLLRHERCRTAETHPLVETHMIVPFRIANTPTITAQENVVRKSYK